MSAEQITNIWKLGSSSWPDLRVTQEEMRAFLEGEDKGQATAATHAGDLYLACACALGHAPAIEAFETRHRPDIVRALQRMGLPIDLRDEVTQTVRTKLFMGTAKGAPLIGKYGGRADNNQSSEFHPAESGQAQCQVVYVDACRKAEQVKFYPLFPGKTDSQQSLQRYLPTGAARRLTK